ncbi:hypothetical protein HYALB_00006165 [Hymenoscyphus albidus]|uniref:Uncharacterized protein n=1 Tax=Hymenoscyphus albidus TaxID=595503 RepID=A0A9N9LKQ8_9HELO|nr:hypothetical protein HYALB_00006165 [Hymenoscyphus albidus]
MSSRTRSDKGNTPREPRMANPLPEEDLPMDNSPTGPKSRLTFGVELESAVAALKPDEKDPHPEDDRNPYILGNAIWTFFPNAFRAMVKTLNEKSIPAEWHDPDVYPPPDEDGDQFWKPLNYQSWVLKEESSIIPPDQVDAIGKRIESKAPDGYHYISAEAISPPFYYSKVCGVLSSNFRNNINPSCGLHIHVGDSKKGFPLKTLINFYVTVWTFEPQLESILPTGRLQAPVYRKLRQHSNLADLTTSRKKLPRVGLRHLLANVKTIEELGSIVEDLSPTKTKQRSVFNMDGLLGVKLGYKWAKPTIEFHQHYGTLNHEEITNWTTLCVGLLEFADTVDSGLLRTYLERHIDHSPDDFGIEQVLYRLGLRNIARYYGERAESFDSVRKLDSPLIKESITIRSPAASKNIPQDIYDRIWSEVFPINKDILFYAHESSGWRNNQWSKFGSSEVAIRWRLVDPIPLYGVDRKTTQRSIATFCRLNRPILIVCDDYQLLDALAAVIPMCTDEHASKMNFTYACLRIDIQQGWPTFSDGGASWTRFRRNRGSKDTPSYGLFPGIYISRVLQMIDCLHSPQRLLGPDEYDDDQPEDRIFEVCKMVFTFNTSNKMYAGQRNLSDLTLERMAKGGHKYTTSGIPITRTTEGLAPVDWQNLTDLRWVPVKPQFTTRQTEIEVIGVNDERAATLQGFFNQPPWTREDSTREANILRQEADIYYEERNLINARMLYSMASQIFTRTRQPSTELQHFTAAELQQILPLWLVLHKLYTLASEGATDNANDILLEKSLDFFDAALEYLPELYNLRQVSPNYTFEERASIFQECVEQLERNEHFEQLQYWLREARNNKLSAQAADWNRELPGWEFLEEKFQQWKDWEAS